MSCPDRWQGCIASSLPTVAASRVTVFAANERGRPARDAHFSQSLARVQAGSCTRAVRTREKLSRRRPSSDRCFPLALLRHFPGLNQLVVVDGHSGRLLVGELALRSDIAVFLGLVVPVLGRFLLVELRTELALHARFLETRHDGILVARQSVHRLLRRLLAGDRPRDVLPPPLCELPVFRHVDAGRRPQFSRGAAIAYHPAANWRHKL